MMGASTAPPGRGQWLSPPGTQTKAKPLVVRWVERVQSAGIRSVISLLDTAQHERYYGPQFGLHDQGLFGYLKAIGLVVVHYPLTDYQTSLQRLHAADRGGV
jgi:hypothetical protein